MQGKNLTRKQKELVAKKKLNPSNWLAVKNTGEVLIIKHKESGRTRMIIAAGNS